MTGSIVLNELRRDDIARQWMIQSAPDIARREKITIDH